MWLSQNLLYKHIYLYVGTRSVSPNNFWENKARLEKGTNNFWYTCAFKIFKVSFLCFSLYNFGSSCMVWYMNNILLLLLLTLLLPMMKTRMFSPYDILMFCLNNCTKTQKSRNSTVFIQFAHAHTHTKILISKQTLKYFIHKINKTKGYENSFVCNVFVSGCVHFPLSLEIPFIIIA